MSRLKVGGPAALLAALAVGWAPLPDDGQRAFKAAWDDVAVPPTALHKGGPAASFDKLPAFSNDALAKYPPDGGDSELRRAVRRARALLWVVAGKAADAPADLRGDVRDQAAQTRGADAWLRSDLRAPQNEAQFKAQVVSDSREAARALGALTDALDALDAVAPDRGKEPPRWQANYDYVRARLLAQIAYLYEYQSALGDMRKELPPRDPQTQGGWALVSAPQLVGDSAGKKAAKESAKLLKRIAVEHKGTPWALLAEREEALPLGLVWRAVP
jgi:hypothetical protein